MNTVESFFEEKIRECVRLSSWYASLAPDVQQSMQLCVLGVEERVLEGYFEPSRKPVVVAEVSVPGEVHRFLVAIEGNPFVFFDTEFEKSKKVAN